MFLFYNCRVDLSRGLLRLQNVHAKGFPYEGKLSPQATAEVVQLGNRTRLHLIRHGCRRATFPP